MLRIRMSCVITASVPFAFSSLYRGVNISLASKGEEEASLKKIVFRTGTAIRVLDETDIPDLWNLQNCDGEARVQALQILEGTECPKEENEREYQPKHNKQTNLHHSSNGGPLAEPKVSDDNDVLNYYEELEAGLVTNTALS